MLVRLIITTIVGLTSWLLINLLRNYKRAQKIGFPILVTPLPFRSPLWQLSEPWIAPVLRRVPFGLANFVLYSTRDWFYAARYNYHERHGRIFVIVSPDNVQVIIADAGIAEESFARRKDFVKEHAMYSLLEIYGPNVDTINGEAWQRHRRITAPPFNERNSGLVWRASREQADSMLKTWLREGEKGVVRMDRDIMTLALHVLCEAGFGKSYAFDQGVAAPAEGHSMSYRDALKFVLENIAVVVATKAMSIPAWILPAKYSMVDTALREFKQYMVEMVEAERSAVRSSEKDNLMSALVRASNSEAQKGSDRNGLSDDEIFGNSFIYNLAGHDTTALTATYAIALLSTDAKLQSWLREETNFVVGTKESGENWEYEKAFPQLTRCLAVMYETLRLYGPVIYTPRYTAEESQTLVVEGKEHVIPPHTHVVINQAGLHSLRETWGPDSLVWRPGRWLVPESRGKLGEEELIQTPPGTYLPWISGPRVCPGKKFAQVEFVAVIASIFHQHRVRPLTAKGESQEAAVKKVLEAVEDSGLRITLSMRNPEKIKLVWEEII